MTDEEQAPRPAARGETATTEPTKLERATARGVAESKATVPHLYADAQADMSAWTDALADEGAAARDAVVWAAARALRDRPRLNGAYRDGAFDSHSRVNVGIVVPAGAAFAVPTIFDADAKDPRTIAREASELEQRVADGSITQPELSGGTFSVAAPSRRGFDSLTPIVHRGQAGALGAGELAERPLVRDGAVVAAPSLRLVLACDARLVSPDEAAAFLGLVRDHLTAGPPAA